MNSHDLKCCNSECWTLNGKRQQPRARGAWRPDIACEHAEHSLASRNSRLDWKLRASLTGVENYAEPPGLDDFLNDCPGFGYPPTQRTITAISKHGFFPASASFPSPEFGALL